MFKNANTNSKLLPSISVRGRNFVFLDFILSISFLQIFLIVFLNSLLMTFLPKRYKNWEPFSNDYNQTIQKQK